MAPSTEMMDAQQLLLTSTPQQRKVVVSKVPRVQSESTLSTSTDLESISSDIDEVVMVVNEVSQHPPVLPVVPEAAVDQTAVTVDLPEEKNNQTPTEEKISQTPTKPAARRRSSILKHYLAEEIPIRDKGWRNLPKPDLNNIPKSQTSLRSSSSTPRRVSFKSIEFRCHDQTVGDNPSVSIGTPVTLDWTYEDMDPIDFETYESQRSDRRRNLRQMMMNYFQRRTLLSYRYGISDEELDAAEQSVNKVRHQRAVTRALLPTFFIEDLVTSAARKTKRALMGKKPQSVPETTTTRSEMLSV